jgi:hypothetical protein
MPNEIETLVNRLVPGVHADWVNEDMALVDYRASIFIVRHTFGTTWAVYEKGYNGRLFETSEGGWPKCLDWIERNRY